MQSNIPYWVLASKTVRLHNKLRGIVRSGFFSNSPDLMKKWDGIDKALNRCNGYLEVRRQISGGSEAAAGGGSRR